MSSTTYLITGANRGIGRGLVESLLQRPNTVVIAGVRDLQSPSTKKLSSLPVAQNSKLITIHIDSTSELSAKEAIQALQATHDITALDVVIANAGIAKYYGLAADTPLSEVREHFEVNTLGPLALFQATWPLLQKAATATTTTTTTPKFVQITTGLASLGLMGELPAPVTAYGASKAAANYITRKIHFENPGLIAFPLSPGWVQTEMGNMGAVNAGMEAAPVTLKDSVNGILEKIDSATREHTSGTFQSYDGLTFPW